MLLCFIRTLIKNNIMIVKKIDKSCDCVHNYIDDNTILQ